MRKLAKQKTTLYLDEEVLRRTEPVAAESGRDQSAVVEDARRRHLGPQVVEQVSARNAKNALDADAALELQRATTETAARALETASD